MTIAIIGIGSVGGTLGTSWAAKGHRIIFGVRDPKSDKVKKALTAAGSNALAATVPEAVAQAPVIVLAVPWQNVEGALKDAGDLAGKVIVDAINPLEINSGRLQLALGQSTSAAEQIQGWAKEAKVVKAFNTIGAPNMANPRFGNQSATMFICGDDAGAKLEVTKLSNDLGFETEDAGPLASARLLEPMAMLWIHLALDMGWGTDFGFKALRRLKK